MTHRGILAAAVLALLSARLLEFILLRPRRARGAVRAPWTTWANWILGSAFCFGAAYETTRAETEPLWGLCAAGAALYVLRLLLKLWSVRTLGDAWSNQIEVRREQPLVREGPYRWVRHPIYLGLFLEPVAVALIANAPVSGVAGVLVLWPLFWIRLRLEEAELRRHFGPAYETYAKEVPALVPRLSPVKR